MEKCRVLEEYSRLVAVTREYMLAEKDMQTALNKAMDSCIERGILKEFLLKNRAEVLGMLLEEFDVDKYERSLREEGREEGTKQGVDRMARLIKILIQSDRLADLERASTDTEYRERLFREFDL